MNKLLDEINRPNDIKKIPKDRLPELASEIRDFIVDHVSRTGGHLASNLGTVELTMAIHLVCDLPKDKIVFDVGHQCYTHKILTGRKDGFDTLRRYKGMSGFPKRCESTCDVFDTGHSSTSISVALGLAKARDLSGRDEKIFALIGDGALSGGLAYEALNNAARLRSNMIIVLNDNQMSISKNVGGMSNYLGRIRTNKKYNDLKNNVKTNLAKLPNGRGVRVAGNIRSVKDTLKRMFIPGMLFEDMGLTYIGPIDGHDIGQMVEAFNNALRMNEPVIVHVCTRKGKGYRPAEKYPSRYHGVGAFNVSSGSSGKADHPETYSHVFGDELIKLADNDKRIVAVTAAMPGGTGLLDFQKAFPDRFFDVGIEEEHAITYSAGMAAGGLRPVVPVYSTFLQRAYDEIMSDVCLNNMPVVIGVDRSGIVGSDGETHQGIYDIAYLRHMPGLTVMAPKGARELREMLAFALTLDGPAAIKYPRGEAVTELDDHDQAIALGRSEILVRGSGIALIAVGSMVMTAYKAALILKNKGINVTVVNARFVSPIDTEMLDSLSESHKTIYTLEEGVIECGFGEEVDRYYSEDHDVKVHNFGFPDKFISHGSPEILLKNYGLDAGSIAMYILKAYTNP
ncbi:MAG: 1-deoxy-D-xylulose-5-phosphate synthase [Lachnospiraceae bacterium]|nr:1-deoxy-D-xylulose-5-phosphate synthase [Lachnospiraceae bacterium]MEE3461004.1 1-deoxy-D-xylulose-5-phosphate synthase [Lachnospiraceae bacterium]